MAYLAMAFPCFDDLVDLEQPPNRKIDAGTNSVSAAFDIFLPIIFAWCDQVGCLLEDCAGVFQSPRTAPLQRSSKYFDENHSRPTRIFGRIRSSAKCHS